MAIIIFILNLILIILQCWLYIVFGLQWVLSKPFLFLSNEIIKFKNKRKDKKWRKHTNTYDHYYPDFNVKLENNEVTLNIKDKNVKLTEEEFQSLLNYYGKLNNNYYDFKRRKD